jgi:hypothetical protein
MSVPEWHASVSPLPNRFGIAEFGPNEVETILGNDSSQHQLAASNFNWIAAYLCEEVGIFEYEVTDWFRSKVRGLGAKSPLAVWGAEDGFQKVFDYAQVYKQQVDEDLGEEPTPVGIELSHQIANSALDVILKGFEAAGVDIPAYDGDDDFTCHTIHNPDREELIKARWKRIGDLVDYHITKKEGPVTSSYFIVRYLERYTEPLILQTGIGCSTQDESSRDQPIERTLNIDSDIDGRPSSVGEVALFVVPLANEIRNNTLVRMR